MALNASLEVRVTEDVEFVFEVRNTGADPVELAFPSGKTADVRVYGVETDEIVWQWSADKLFTQAITTETLDPEQTLTRKYTWQNPPAGRYKAVTTLEAEVTAEARAEFSVSRA